ncbi:MAG: hypothetical protein ABIS92_18515 [Polyangia bacterium]
MKPSSRAALATIFLTYAGCGSTIQSDFPDGAGGAGVHGGTGGAGTGGTDQTGGAPGSGGTASGGLGGPAGDSGGGTGTGGRGSGETGGAGGSAGRGIPGTATGGTATGGTAAGGASGPGCPAGAFLCEGFETQMAGAAPGAPWVPDTLGNGKITVDTTKSFSGQKSVHVTGMMNGFQGDRANIATPMVIGSKTVWVRFMMYTASYPASSGVHTRLMRLGTTAGAALGSPESSYSFATYNGTAIEKVNTVLQRSAGTKLNDSANRNRWICWEFEIDKTGGVGKVVPHIWLDMRELSLSPAGGASHGATSPSWDPINIEVFIMGLEGYQPDPIPADYWIDDVIISSQRVGCQAPR